MSMPAKRPRGRPPAYDRDTALADAGDVFWKTGYSAATVDGLSTAMGMNRPSLYNAFGDKHAIYLQTFDRYAKASQALLDNVLAGDRPLAEQITAVYDGAIGIYLAGDGGARGCFLVGTAVSEAADDAAIRDRLLAALKAIDHAFEARFVRARADGELDPDADPRALAQVAGGVLNALAVRARAGESKESLKRTARQTVKMIVGR